MRLAYMNREADSAGSSSEVQTVRFSDDIGGRAKVDSPPN